MGGLLETLVVGVVVGGAVFWAVRAGLRSMKKGKICSTCGDAGNCPLAGQEPTPVELGDLSGDRRPHS